MAKQKRYWLFKSEPSVYSIDDLERDKTTHWEGVRNYQARNLLRDDIGGGDEVLYYHSNAKPTGIAGIAKVVKGGYPDPDQFDPKSKYHDPKADAENPRWFVVDIRFVKRFKDVVSLEDMKAEKKLADMMVTKRGSRLSVQPVTKAEFDHVVKMSRR